MRPLPPEPDALRLDKVDGSTLHKMFSTEGMLLNLVASDAPTLDALSPLCTSLRELVGAEEATLRIPDPGGSVTVVRADRTGVAITTIDGRPAADTQPTADSERATSNGQATGNQATGDQTTRNQASSDQTIGNQASGNQASSEHRLEVHSAEGRLAGILHCRWDDGDQHPSAVDEWIVWRYGLLTVLIAERRMTNLRRLEAIARERERLAGFIHDDPVQTITAINLRLQRMALRLNDPEQEQAVEDLRRLSSETIDSLRHLLFSLHPTTLEEDGLEYSLETYCESFVESEGLAWEIHGGPIADMPFEISALAFRLARDAIFNVVKHAKASKLTIGLSSADQSVRIVIVDDGIGFDATAELRPVPGHYGLEHAKTLAGWAGGTYVISSRIGAGTEVTIELPLV